METEKRLEEALGLPGLCAGLRRQAWFMALRPDQVDDFLQEGLVAAWKAHRHYQMEGKPQKEILRLCFRSGINGMRSWQRRLVRFESVAPDVPRPAPTPNPERRCIAQETIQKSKEQLSTTHTRVIDAFERFGPELTLTEAAAIAGVARVTASRARHEFAQAAAGVWGS